MRQFTVTLTEEQYAFVKDQGRGWLKDVIQRIIDARSTDNPGYFIDDPKRPRPWWRLW